MLFFIKTFGCQMNIADSQIISAILEKNGFKETDLIDNADVILINTCSIRDKAEKTLFKNIEYIKSINKPRKRIIGILGCMAQRLKESLLENVIIDFVAGPDSYRELPHMINKAINNLKDSSVNFKYSENYEDITPKYNSNISAYIPISRGCDNMCTYCVVPYTRGPQKDRNINTIIKEVEHLSKKNYKEITLLGENVNLYKCKCEKGEEYDFADLLDILANINNKIRVRFISSYPKLFTDKLINVIKKNNNICNHIHLPLQSGSNKILKLMNRQYDIDEYMFIIDKIKHNINNCQISTDIITGFCNEDDIDHQETLNIIKKARFSQVFSFIYSERSGTYSAKFLKDNVPLEIKTKRLNEISELQHKISLEDNKKDINNTYKILVEGYSKKNKNKLFGRTEGNKIVILDTSDDTIKIGDFINVKINNCTSATLFGNKV